MVGFSHSGWGLKVAGNNAADLRDAAVRRHRRQRVHRRRRARRLRFHLGRRYADRLGAEHLVSHAQLRLHGAGSAARPIFPASTASASGWAAPTSSCPRTSRSITTSGSPAFATAAATAATGWGICSISRSTVWASVRTRQRAGRGRWRTSVLKAGGQPLTVQVKAAALLADKPREDIRPSRCRSNPTGTSSEPGSADRQRAGRTDRQRPVGRNAANRRPTARSTT